MSIIPPDREAITCLRPPHNYSHWCSVIAESRTIPPKVRAILGVLSLELARGDGEAFWLQDIAHASGQSRRATRAALKTAQDQEYLFIQTTPYKDWHRYWMQVPASAYAKPQPKRYKKHSKFCDSVRYKALYRDNFQCVYCHAPITSANVTFDHIIPTSLGGTHELTNCATACRSCNASKGSRINWTPPEGKEREAAGCRDGGRNA